nr:prepilin peptidase [Pseudoclavibacter sp. Marseille-Q3772]
MIGAWCCAAYVAVATVPLARHDLREHRLPNAWTMPGWLVALVAIAVQAVASGQLPLLPVLAAGSALVMFLVFALVAGMGMGDLKLAVPLAAGLGFFGMHLVAFALLLALASGAALAAVLLMRGRARDTAIAFGPFLLFGYWCAFAVGTVSGTTV